jgi:hypothetical protein
MSKEKILAWHFLRGDGCIAYDHSFRRDGNGKTVKPKEGQVLKVSAEDLELCRFGLHASIEPRDALKYAPGPLVSRVELSGTILKGDDKLCASQRKVLWIADATKILHEFACLCAEDALKVSGWNDERSVKAIEAKRKWLKGEISDDELSAAESAAWSVVRSAAWSAAESAAWSAAWSAAESAARSAAESAAWSAAWSAARSAQNDRLKEMFAELEKNNG